jgi:molybdopterin molybdotransferase
MPEGFDTVFMHEDVREEGGCVALPAGLKPGANRRLAGEDVLPGARVMEAGRRLGPEDLCLLAALGLGTVAVRRRLRVAVFSTGNEVREPGGPLKEAGIYDANRFLLQALLARLGCAVADLGILPDDLGSLRSALGGAAAGHDLLVTSGGVSTGDEDHVKAAVERLGGLAFWRLGIKPGRPVALGVIGGAAFIGLPGNPVAVFVTFVHVARALVAALSGETYAPPRAWPVRAGFAYRKKEGRREFVRVRLRSADDGAVEAMKHPREGAGVITSLTETDGLAELPETVTRVEPGETVGFLPYAVLR